MRRWDEEDAEDLDLMGRWDEEDAEDLDLMGRWDEEDAEDLDLMRRWDLMRCDEVFGLALLALDMMTGLDGEEAGGSMNT